MGARKHVRSRVKGGKKVGKEKTRVTEGKETKLGGKRHAHHRRERKDTHVTEGKERIYAHSTTAHAFQIHIQCL
jgi:hypothetical protein